MSAQEKVGKYMSKRGLSYASQPRPSKYNDMPSDPTALNMRALGRHYSACIAWYGYASSELSKVTIDVLDLGNRMGRLKAKLNIQFETKIKEKYKRDQRVHDNEEFAKLEFKFMMATAKQTALQSVVDRYERYSAALSREMSRRGYEMERVGRQT